MFGKVVCNYYEYNHMFKFKYPSLIVINEGYFYLFSN